MSPLTAEALPREEVRARPQSTLSWMQQFRLLFRLQYTDYRASLPFFLVFSILMPVGFLYAFGSNVTRPGADNGWFLAGNVVMSVCFGAASFAIARVAWLRIRHEMDYYGTLPVKRSAFLATVFCLGQISALPGMVSSLLVGSWQLGIPLQNTLAAVPLTLLAAASLTLVGAGVGGLARTQAEVNLYSNVLYLVVIFLSPVLAPVDRLPALMRATSYLFPTGQAAMAITDVLQGDYGPRFWMLLGLLCLWLLAAGVLVVKRLDWRN